MPFYDFLRPVAFDPLCARVPTGNGSFRIQHQNRIVFDPFHQKPEPFFTCAKLFLDSDALQGFRRTVSHAIRFVVLCHFRLVLSSPY